MKLHPSICLAALIPLAGCGGIGYPDPTKKGPQPGAGAPLGTPGAAKTSTTVRGRGKPVTSRSSNLKGQVLVMEYHHILDKEGPTYRSPLHFKQDLDRLYMMGFRPVTMTEYVQNRMPLEPGASPVVITFDDSNPTQFKLLPNGSVDPNCGVGIWQKFAKAHPDFPVHGTFYVTGDMMWDQSKWLSKKIKMLKAMGSEVQNHTMTHPSLSKITDEQVKYQIGEQYLRLVHMGVPPPTQFALPFGDLPKNLTLLKGFTYKGKRIGIESVVLSGSGPAPSPSEPSRNVYRIPRIMAVPGGDGIDFWLDQVQSGKTVVYVK